MKYTVVMPVKASDFYLVEMNYKYIKKYLPVKKIVIITSTKGINQFSKLGDDVDIVDENKMYEGMNFDSVKAEMRRNGLEVSQTGHCFQQLLKMAYCFISDDDGFLVWDADTMPIKKIPIYNEKTKKYIFYMRDEYTPRYFDHMQKLLGIGKQVKKSFITEHMYFQNEILQEIIQSIENHSAVSGDTWWKKIIAAMICGNGMSEYEIYGTYTTFKYPDRYEQRNVNALRYGRSILGANPSNEKLEWIREEYDAVSFEHYDKETFFTKLSSFSIVRRINPRFYANVISFANRGINKLRKIAHK